MKISALKHTLMRIEKGHAKRMGAEVMLYAWKIFLATKVILM